MGAWNFYFILKLFLYAQDRLDFHPWKNLAFALLLLIPLKQPRWTLLRQFIAVPLGIALLYHDSLLPPFARVWSQLGNLSDFSAIYFIELIGRVIDARAIVILLLLLAAYLLLNMKLRMTTFVIGALLALPLMQHFFANPRAIAATHSSPLDCPTQASGQPSDAIAQTNIAHTNEPPTDANLNRQLDNFFAQEANRHVEFPRATSQPKNGSGFDIIVLQICSLASDDLKEINQEHHPLFSKFDIRFDQFNSAASYSGPAAIRLLRGSCGQQRHAQLYDNAPSQCYTFNALAQAGFDAQLLMNHDGHFGNFLADVRERGGLSVAPQENTHAPIAMRSFDNSPIYDDYAELSQWWQHRIAADTTNVALYYNSISLHDGNRLPNNSNSMKTYPQRATKLLSDIDRFLTLVESSGRKAVVVVVPEHGAALHGDSAQIAGMREIPSPQITRVPVGIKLIGMNNTGAAQIIDTPTSYLALTDVLAKIAATQNDNTALNLESLLQNVPLTAFVAENDSLAIMQRGEQYFFRNSDNVWLQSE